MQEDQYTPPAADLSEEVRGGDLERAVRGDYELAVGDVLNEAWERIAGNKATLWGAYIVFGIIAFVLSWVLGQVGIDPQAYYLRGEYLSGMSAQMLAVVLSAPIQAPLGAGLFMLALKLLLREPTGVGELFAYFGRMVPLVVVAIVTSVLTGLGFVLLVLPGIYLYVALFFAPGLVAAHGLGPLEAMKVSLLSVTRQWFTVFAIMVMGVLIILAGFALLGVGLVWALPMTSMIYAVVFRQIFGTSWAGRP